MILPSYSFLATAGVNAAEQANVFAQVLESRGVVLAVCGAAPNLKPCARLRSWKDALCNSHGSTVLSSVC